MVEKIINYLTVDVEDYYQVSAFEEIIEVEDWDSMEHRVAMNTGTILELLQQHAVKATFFIVGWVAEKYPELVRAIQREGHEIGCHSYWHRKVYDLSPEEFRKDTLAAKNVLEKIAGKEVLGYRAPSYSITRKSLWALDILKDLGFSYDSSIFPIYHDTYGIHNAPRFEYQLQGLGMTEYPISTSIFAGYKVPIGGGGYFRLFPYWFTRMALRRINKIERKPFVFYIHPWEIDPDQPRISNARRLSKFRHYNNLSGTTKRFGNLLKEFEFKPLPVPSVS